MAGRVAGGAEERPLPAEAPPARLDTEKQRRPLGIPAISDRVAQMAALLVIGPIFETDLLANQYGFRPGMDAKMAIRRAFWHITDGLK